MRQFAQFVSTVISWIKKNNANFVTLQDALSVSMLSLAKFAMLATS